MTDKVAIYGELRPPAISDFYFWLVETNFR